MKNYRVSLSKSVHVCVQGSANCSSHSRDDESDELRRPCLLYMISWLFLLIIQNLKASEKNLEKEKLSQNLIRNTMI